MTTTGRAFIIPPHPHLLAQPSAPYPARLPGNDTWSTAEWRRVSWFASPAYTAPRTVDRPGALDIARLRTCSAGSSYNHRTFFHVVTDGGQSCPHTPPPDSPSRSSLSA